MSLFMEVPLQDAEKAKRFLLDHDAFDHDYVYIKTETTILYPVLKSFEKANLPYPTVKRRGTKSMKRLDLKTALAPKLSEDIIDRVKTSFDVVGSIAILEIDDELREHEQTIATTLLKMNKQIKTVVAKEGIHHGEFRTQDHRYLAGDKTFETIHRENRCRIRVDINKTYFSVRLATERKRIAQQVQLGEEILVLFSGCGPYPCVFAKITEAKGVVGIEKNIDAHELALKNVELNKLDNVHLINADVKEAPDLGTFDRVLMPLPKSAEDFLKAALPFVKPGGMLHFYDFLHEDQFDDAKLKILKACAKEKRHADFRGLIRCGQHAPHIYRICVDVLID